MRAYKIAKSLVGRHALLIILAASLSLAYSIGVKAQQATEPELAVKLSYDRFQNVTFYETSRMELEPQDKKEYGGTTLTMTAAFACKGNTGQQPCYAPSVSLRFSYIGWGGGTPQPFNYTYRNVIAIADGANIPLGTMAVNHDFLTPETKSTFWYGSLSLDLTTLRRLATAKDVEMRVGIMPVTISREQKVLLAGLFNLSVQAAPKPAPKTRKSRQLKRGQ